MNLKAVKITGLVLAVIMIFTAVCFTGCSKSKTASLDEEVTVEQDDDDAISVNMLSEDEGDTFELTDRAGNTLTLVPIYGCDGATMIAAYVQTVKDSDDNELDSTAYPELHAVLQIKQENDTYSLVYGDGDKLVTIDAQADENGYIVAMQDTMDYDGDGDTTEYFKVVTKLDATSHLFIKLESEDNKTPINVTVEKASDGTATVTDKEGNTTKTTSTTEAKKDLTQVVEDDKKKKEEETQNESTSDDPTEPSSSDIPTVEGYTVIVLSTNGTVKTNADNVTVEGGTLVGGSEVHIDGAGDNSKYYITSDTSTFLGQIVVELSVEDDVEVKFNNVNINTQKKTAIKLVNKDAVENKESDTEGSGSAELGTTGTAVTNTAVPRCELSFTGTNSIQANGSGNNGSIYSECKLGIKGHGTVTVDGGSSLSGICSTESITIKNTTLNITSRAKQGISCDKKVTINSGATVNIESKGDGIHCNKFELDGVDADGISADSVVNISSIYSTECADGIDADNEVIIDGGTLNITALTSDKYGIKVRKVIKGASNGYFEINGGKVNASGWYMTVPTSCAQKTVVATSSSATSFTAGKYSSASGAGSFLVSPSNANAVTAGSTTNTVTWNSGKTIGQVSF